MELPKNIVQIGEPDKLHKIFVEDYVVSYMKQLGRNASGVPVGLALYGKRMEENGINYYFLYGAAKIDGLEHRGAYLSQVEKEEIEDIGRRYFEDYKFLAWCSVTEEPVESFFLKINGKGVEIKGYACFYEKNESMLNYMLLSGEKEAKTNSGKEASPERVRGTWTASAYIKQAVKGNARETDQEEKAPLWSEKESGPRKRDFGRPKREKKDTRERGKAVRQGLWKPEYNKAVLAAACFAILVLAVRTLNNKETMEELQVAARQVIAGMSEQKLPDEREIPPVDSVTSGNVLQGNTSSLLEERENTEPADSPRPADGSAALTQTGSAEPSAQPADGEDTAESSPQPSVEPEPSDEPEPSEEPKPSEEPAVESSVMTVTYTVQRGDTLNSICRERYGSPDRVAEICELNNIKNADSIQIGQIILLP